MTSEMCLAARRKVFIVHCAAHTLQLGIRDFLDKTPLCYKDLKNLVKELRKPCHAKTFQIYGLNVPVLCNATRWFSYFKMVRSILGFKNFIENEAILRVKFPLTETDWVNIKILEKILTPFYNLNLMLQKPGFLISEFFMHYTFIVEEFKEKHKNEIELLLECISKKMKKLFDSEIVKAAVYLDVRVRDLLPRNYKEIGKNICLELFKTLPNVNSSQRELNKSINTHENLSDPLVAFLASKKTKRVDVNENNVENCLDRIDNLDSIDCREDIFLFWKNQQFLTDGQKDVINAILSTPATQVSVERTFSDLSNTMSNKRSRLSTENLRNIIFLRINNRINK